MNGIKRNYKINKISLSKSVIDLACFDFSFILNEIASIATLEHLSLQGCWSFYHILLLNSIEYLLPIAKFSRAKPSWDWRADHDWISAQPEQKLLKASSESERCEMPFANLSLNNKADSFVILVSGPFGFEFGLWMLWNNCRDLQSKSFNHRPKLCGGGRRDWDSFQVEKSDSLRVW